MVKNDGIHYTIKFSSNIKMCHYHSLSTLTLLKFKKDKLKKNLEDIKGSNSNINHN